jgi:hypothetical protein
VKRLLGEPATTAAGGDDADCGTLNNRDDPTGELLTDAVLFLASSQASFPCGTNIDVDGGHQRGISEDRAIVSRARPH